MSQRFGFPTFFDVQKPNVPTWEKKLSGFGLLGSYIFNYIKQTRLAKSLDFGQCLGMGQKKNVREANVFGFRTFTVYSGMPKFESPILNYAEIRTSIWLKF